MKNPDPSRTYWINLPERRWVHSAKRYSKLAIYLQDRTQGDALMGKNFGANLSSSTLQMFGITNPATCDWISREITGSYLHQRRQGGRIVHESTIPLWSSTEVRDALGKIRPLQLIKATDGRPPMRLRRPTFKPITVEGNKFPGLDLDGHFEGLPSKGQP